MSSELNADLVGTGLVVFEGRVIHEARPPISPEQLEAVAARCRGSVPQGLIDLWSTSFGGRLDYELFAPLQDSWHWMSFTELFYPGSSHYHDLWGWIDHEASLAKEVAQERSEVHDGLLEYLPFGGFEYLERLYVRTLPGPNHGEVVAWIQGLPPAWGGRLEGGDALLTIAKDVPALFRQLSLSVDPFNVIDGDADSGLELAEAIDGLADDRPDVFSRLKTVVANAVKPRPSNTVRA